LLSRGFGCGLFFNGSFFVSPCWFEISLVLIVHFRWPMSRVLTLLLASFPKLARLFYLCRCPPLLCFSLVLFLLFLGVGFGLSLIPFWGCLSLISCALVYFIGSLEPSSTKSNKLFIYPLTELLETRWTN
jgi:hypothetical protein